MSVVFYKVNLCIETVEVIYLVLEKLIVRVFGLLCKQSRNLRRSASLIFIGLVSDFGIPIELDIRDIYLHRKRVYRDRVFVNKTNFKVKSW